MLFCSPGDKETKLCAWEAGSVPPGYIKAFGVQLPSQPPLSPGEQELFAAPMDRNLVHKCCLSPWEGFSDVFSACEQYLDPLHISTQKQVLLACCSPDTLTCVGESMAEVQDCSPACLG